MISANKILFRQMLDLDRNGFVSGHERSLYGNKRGIRSDDIGEPPLDVREITELELPQQVILEIAGLG